MERVINAGNKSFSILAPVESKHLEIMYSKNNVLEGRYGLVFWYAHDHQGTLDLLFFSME